MSLVSLVGLGSPLNLTPLIEQPQEPRIQPIQTETFSELDLKGLAMNQGLTQVQIEQVIETVRCESGFIPQQSLIPNPSGPNGREDSWGIWQIHLPSHPDVTREQAMDPEWSTNWALERFKENPKMWTCWRDLYLSQ